MIEHRSLADHEVADRASKLKRKSNTKSMAYYDVSSDPRGVPGYDIINYDSLQKDKAGLRAKVSWPQGYLVLPNGPWQFPHYDATPRLLFDRKLGRAPRDLESIDTFWIVSEQMKAVIEAVDPESCDFVRCEVVLASGEPGPERWLCSVTRAFVGAVDIDQSENLLVTRDVNGKYSLGLNGLTQLRLKKEMIGSAQLFRIGEMASTKFCNQNFKDACKVANIKGIKFQLISN